MCGFLKRGVKDSGVFDGFGEELVVMADLFHVIYNIGLGISEKHPLKWEFLNAISDALTTSDKADIEAWRSTMNRDGWTDDEIADAMSRGTLRKYLHTIGDEEAKTKAIERVEDIVQIFAGKWDPTSSTTVLANPETVKAIGRLKELIRNDQIGDPEGVTMYFCLDSSAKVKKYYTSRGSSQLESFWKSLEVIFNGPNCSPEGLI